MIVSTAKQRRDLGFAFPASSSSAALAALTSVEFSGLALFLRNYEGLSYETEYTYNDYIITYISRFIDLTNLCRVFWLSSVSQEP